ncbi:eukaryotic translation initiation factor 4 gamma 1-like [Conger conger]|uniref:eukaryotic translation initiation factor 4 gamma 1-like n=1 Tax=Conger conger TaxID=82655 RepID=UPI002A5A62FE|nr:eukaryotic translation initiation factor 4 gamma 1-like [Conger conger]
MAEELSMHQAISTLLNSQGEGALECLCCLLSTIGSKLDCGQAKYHMDKYFHQIEQILKNGKKTARIRFMLQDITDLRQNNWAPRSADQGPKTISQVHKDAELETQQERSKVQQQIKTKNLDQHGYRRELQNWGREQYWNHGERQAHQAEERWGRAERRGGAERRRCGEPQPTWNHGGRQQDEGINTAPASEQTAPINTSQGPKTISQVHKDAEVQTQQESSKVEQQLQAKVNSSERQGYRQDRRNGITATVDSKDGGAGGRGTKRNSAGAAGNTGTMEERNVGTMEERNVGAA